MLFFVEFIPKFSSLNFLRYLQGTSRIFLGFAASKEKVEKKQSAILGQPTYRP